MAVEIRTTRATLADAVVLAALLRRVEAEEVRAATDRDVLPVLVDAVKDSTEAWAVRFNDALALLWGVVAVPSIDGPADGVRRGVAWLLTTDLVDRQRKSFWKMCKRDVPQLFKRWDILANAIDVRHGQALRWARRLGFRLRPPEPVRPGGPLFCVFTVTREDVVCALQR